MRPDEPLIAILMAVYEPGMPWIEEQLKSLNAQTYPNIRLYIRDDGSSDHVYASICKLAEKIVTAFPYVISRNEKNIGVNGTFELLTRDARGEYFAYCDQDDIWFPEKLAVLAPMIKGNRVLAYSDMEVIDARGVTLAQSLKQIRPRLEYVSGEGLAETYFFRNCTAGCCMMVRSDIAKKAVPFPKRTMWDHWVAIVSASQGEISFTSRCLMSYRQHDHNQTGVLYHICTKEDYKREKLEPLEERLQAYKRIKKPSEEMEEFIFSRINKKLTGIWKHRRFSPYEASWEIATSYMPDKIYQMVIGKIKR